MCQPNLKPSFEQTAHRDDPERKCNQSFDQTFRIALRHPVKTNPFPENISAFQQTKFRQMQHHAVTQSIEQHINMTCMHICDEMLNNDRGVHDIIDR